MGHVRQLDDSRSYSAMRQLCSDLRQFAIQVRQLGYSCSTAEWRERECLDLCECMLVAVKHAEMMADDRRCGAPYSGQQIWLHCHEPGCISTVLIWPRRRRDEAPLPPWTMREGDIFCPEHSEQSVPCIGVSGQVATSV